MIEKRPAQKSEVCGVSQNVSEISNVNPFTLRAGQNRPDNFDYISQTIAFFGEYLKEKS